MTCRNSTSEMVSKGHSKSGKDAKAKPAERPPPTPKWPPLQPLVPTSDLALETVLEDQIILIRNLFTSTLCKNYVSFLSTLPLITTPAKPQYGDALRVNDRIQFDDYDFARQLWELTALQSLVAGSTEAEAEGTLGQESARKLWGGRPVCLNPRIRIYRYKAGQFFAQHCKPSLHILFFHRSSEIPSPRSFSSSKMSASETVSQRALALLFVVLDPIRSYLHAILCIAVAFYMTNWALYGILMDIIWAMKDPPDILHSISVWLDFFYDPWSHYGPEKPAILFWMSPFSGWLTSIVVFVLWALPDRVAEVSPDVLNEGA